MIPAIEFVEQPNILALPFSSGTGTAVGGRSLAHLMQQTKPPPQLGGQRNRPRVVVGDSVTGRK